MLIIHGVYHWKPRIVAFRDDYCSRCSGVGLAWQRRTVDVLHLFFVPVLPLNVWSRWRCAKCGRDPHARVRTYHSVKWAGTFLLAFIAGLGWMAATDSHRGDRGFIWSLRIGGTLACALALRATMRSPPDVELAAKLREVPRVHHAACAVCGAALVSIGSELVCSNCGAAWRALEAA